MEGTILPFSGFVAAFAAILSLLLIWKNKLNGTAGVVVNTAAMVVFFASLFWAMYVLIPLAFG